MPEVKECPVYALSGYAEWFWLMLKNWKDVENRDWSLFRYIKPEQLPLRVYLHASKTPASREEKQFIWDTLVNVKQWEEFCLVDFNKLRGCIIGEITITGQVTELDSPWFFGDYGFLVKDGILYDRPIPCRGALRFFRPALQEVPHV